MLNEWTLRTEIAAVASRWPFPFLAFLVGSIIGWGFSYVVPSPFRAELNLSVAYNADAIYTNPDDWKNWQLEQLTAFILSPQVLDATLARLQIADPYWSTVQVEELQAMLNASWRNTGIWHLVAENPRGRFAIQAIQAWTAVILEHYNQATAHAAQLSALDNQIYGFNIAFTQAKWQQTELAGVMEALQAWEAEVARMPSGQPVDELMRWRLWSLVARAAGLDRAWEALLDGFPAPQAAGQDYLPYTKLVIASLSERSNVLQIQIEALRPEQALIQKQRQLAFQGSHGLSANLAVEQALPPPARVKILRPASLTAMIGGFSGLLVWSMLWMSRIPHRRSK